MQWLESQRQNMMLWSPVPLATGVGAYFGLPFEPPLWAGGALGAAVLLWLGLSIWSSGLVRLLFLSLFFLNLGYLAAVYRSASVAAPVLSFRYYGPIEGRVVAIDRSASKALRITLDRVRLNRVQKTPAKVRVSLFGMAPEMALGDRVALVGMLSPPVVRLSRGALIFAAMPGLTGSALLDIRAIRWCRCGHLMMREPGCGLIPFGVAWPRAFLRRLAAKTGHLPRPLLPEIAAG